MAQTNQKPKKKDNILTRILYGRFLSVDFFSQHWKAIALGMLMVMAYITNRYQCLTRMEEIRRLEQQLEVVETERVRERSAYMSRIRESSMQELVDTMRLHLKIQDQPPFKLSKN